MKRGTNSSHLGKAMRLLRQDPVMAPFVRRLPKPEATPTKQMFWFLAESIIYQQLSGSAARTIATRVRKLYSPKQHPDMHDIKITKQEELRAAGLSVQKISYLYDLSDKFIDNTIMPRRFQFMSDEEIRNHLLVVKGIGRWTADMALLFALERPNVLPTGDLGIRKGFQVAFRLKSLPSEKTMLRLARPYQGHWSIFSRYLWLIADEAKRKSEGRSSQSKKIVSTVGTSKTKKRILKK